ncbi:MAG: DegV family protein [Clostridia bacterium]|nr:DegV family protein [Oscillospiraceae bacterium]MBQ3763299.1 DegV family protein [Clostridia bacterium]
MKIKITADSTCDLSPEQIRDNDITIVPLFVNKGDESFLDGVTITPADIFAHVAAGGSLCSTAAVPVGIYQEKFAQLSEGYDALVHISLGSGFSSCYQNACIASEEMKNVRVIDSRNLSSGQGHVVMEACKLAKTATDLDEMKAALEELTPRVDASFLLERLDYMVKGGRCSFVAALGANLLKLKPCIEVVDNRMIVGKKYRGSMVKCIEAYVRDRLADPAAIVPERIFVTHSPVTDEVDRMAHDTIRACMDFDEIDDTRAGCTISCHCGEGCLGILYIRKEAKN